MNRLVAEGPIDLLAQPPGASIDSGDRRNPRHQHAVAARFHAPAGMPRKYDVSVSGPTPMRVNPKSPWARTIGASRRAKIGWGNIEGDDIDLDEYPVRATVLQAMIEAKRDSSRLVDSTTR